ncbi:hypothetical protein N7470_003154 [Penicillium chermesinum]|nr:hypothetical protein N7470_003154 [Penicillium chermesinum]
MTAALNGTFNSAPDTPSPIYPDRLIRPLQNEPSALASPPTRPTPSFTHPPRPHPKSSTQNLEAERQELTPEADPHHAFDQALELESGDEDARITLVAVETVPPQTPAGPDGYDAFENTNNKKKRKIPTPGNLGGHHSTLSPEFANMGLSNSREPSAAPSEGMDTGTLHGTGNPGSPVTSGISGSGRGRLGRFIPRSTSSRTPLSANAQNAWMTARTPTRRDGLMSSPGPSGSSPQPPRREDEDFVFGTDGYHSEGEPSDQGIISTAIANAASLSPPTRGLSNVSLLDQENTTPTKTQFTFTCESDSSKGMAMQRIPYSVPNRSPTSPLAPASHNPRGFSAQGTQTTEGDQAPSTRKKKRSPATVYAMAARQRKIQQQYTNIHHPPNLEDIWICEFCEYESIFGHPPEALIRQYEIKDRKERKRLAEKKRLLEKAKMKGRKTKKAPKNSRGAPHGGYDRASVDHSSATGSGLHEDEYHEYEEEPETPVSKLPSPTSLKPSLPPPGNPKVFPGTNVKGSADAGASRPA